MVQPPPVQPNSQVAPTSQRKAHFPPVHEDEQVEPTSHLMAHPPLVQEKSQPDCPRAQVSVGVVVELPEALELVEPVGDVPPSAPTVQS